jgi:hypothetical protein
MNGMARLGKWLRLAALTGVVALFTAHAPVAVAGNKPEPEIAKAKGSDCVREPEFMIRNHATMLDHQRNDTLRRGIRAGDYSLKRCMECHSNGAAKHADIKTDCDSCHAYAAVKLDCWDCHAKKAPNKAKVSPAQSTQPSPMMSTVQSGGPKQ